MLKTLLAGGVSAAAILTPSTPAYASTCGTLPRAVQGSPGVAAGQAASTYLWHDAQGWKLRVTHPGTSRMLVTGTITVSRSISHLTTYRLERGDAVRVSSDGHTLAFRMTNVGHLDGVSFLAECSPTLRVSIKVNGSEATPRLVHLGAHRVHPTSVPFTIRRS